MAKSEDQIERIVGEVLARLGTAAAVRVDRPHSQPSPASASVSELKLDDKVVSAATLKDRLNGVQRLIVSARAVVTPSARDLLKENNVSLVRTLKSAAAAGVQLILAGLDSRFDTSGLVRVLEKRGIAVTQVTTDEARDAIESISRAIRESGKLGVVLTNRVATAVCVANRHREVRAAAASNRGEIENIIRELGANLLVIDTARRGMSEIERMVTAFVASPQRDCPAALKSMLE
jgi:ribose 5-phosphate isomerase RpiB